MTAPRRFLSVCSGIEAASVAFQPLGWEAVAVAEIEPFPCAVLAHHYPQVPNLGDLTRWREWPVELLAQADVLCGGTPCQGFSVAGLRGSLDDERGNLTLTFCHLYDRLDEIRHAAGRPPAVCLWENVPGVFSTHDNAFGCFLAGLAGEDVPLEPPGGKWTDAGAVRGPRRAVAWRVLDAQYCGLAQRRKRVFVVASAAPAFDPVAVLFEFGGLRRDSAPSRGAGEGTAQGFTTGPSGGELTNLAPTLDTRCKDGPIRNQLGIGVLSAAVADPLTARPYADNASQEGRLVPEVANCLTQRMYKGLNTTLDEGQTPIVEIATAHTLRGEGFDASEDGTGRGTPLVPIAFPAQMSGTQCATEENLCPVLQSHKDGAADVISGPLTANAEFAGDCSPHVVYVALAETQAFTLHGQREGTQSIVSPTDVAGTIREGTGTAIQNSSNTVVQTAWKVRRLTPEECEILQGFPVGYTLIPGTSSRRRKGADLSDTIDYLISLGASAEQAAVLAHSPDGPRYKALGNSWAVPVARWIGARIEAMLSAACAE